MRRSIRSAPGMWHYKTQAQAWRKQLLNHIMAQLPSAALNNKNTNRGQKECRRNRKETENLRTKRTVDRQ